MTVGPSLPNDRSGVIAAARSAGVFTAEEMQVIGELFDDYLRDKEGTGYYFISYRDGDAILGFACWGPTDLTRASADLYWICTAREAQGRGVGAALFRAVEEEVCAIGRWIIIIWTSSRPEYEAARQLYLRMGCTLATRVRDFFDRGDDLCLFTRHLA